MSDSALGRAREAVAGARRLMVLTGAGVSAESGVPTFRGAEGLWKKFDPSELASPEAFRRDPALVWEWYDWRRGKIAPCRPNAAHEAIVELERRKGEGFLLVTQNVDGLHEAAGSERMARMHGSIWRVRRADGRGGDWEDRRVPMEPIPPRDEEGELLRPAVVWFGESLPRGELAKVEAFFAGGVDAVIVAGTAGQITYIQYWAMELRSRGVELIEVNVEPTALSSMASIHVYGKAGEVLPRIAG